MALTLRFHDTVLSVCKLAPDAAVPADILTKPFSAFLRVPKETTLICPVDAAPKNSTCETGWLALELVGPFDFALTGILTQVSVPLAAAGISIFALSTFDTDYVLIKADKREAAKAALMDAGHSFIR